jgi:Zn-dependent peptidase ImmA (M78 family)
MDNFVWKAPPMRWVDIEEKARKFRKSIGLDEVLRFPVIDVLEKILHEELKLVEMRVVDDQDMGSAEGYTDPAGRYIELSQCVYESACLEKNRARWTVAHELGHWMLHTCVPLARVSPDRRNTIRVFENPETQAHQFAAALLMPIYRISSSETACRISQVFGVSLEAAEKRLSYLRRNREKWGGA